MGSQASSQPVVIEGDQAEEEVGKQPRNAYGQLESICAQTRDNVHVSESEILSTSDCTCSHVSHIDSDTQTEGVVRVKKMLTTFDIQVEQVGVVLLTETCIYVCLYLVQCYDVHSMFYCVSCSTWLPCHPLCMYKYLTHSIQEWPDSHDDLLKLTQTQTNSVHITT